MRIVRLRNQQLLLDKHPILIFSPFPEHGVQEKQLDARISEACFMIIKDETITSLRQHINFDIMI